MDRVKELQNNPHLKFTSSQVVDIRKYFGFDNDEKIAEAVDIFDEWVKKQNHFMFKDFDRRYLEALIIRSKGSIERAKSRLDKLCTLKGLLPEVFDNLQIETEFDELNKYLLSYSVPMPTIDNYRVVVLQFTGYVPKNISLLNVARYAVTCSEYTIMRDYITGFIGIIDLNDVVMSTFLNLLNPVMLQKFMTLLMEGYGVKIKGIHVISNSKLIDTAIGLFKQGVSAKVSSRIKVHASYSSLYEDIPEDLLPKDFGGNLGTSAELNRTWFNEVYSAENQKNMDKSSKWSTDESKRLTEDFNKEYLGTPGTFRSLVVD